MKWLFSFLFIARIVLPLAGKITYEAEHFEPLNGYYRLLLTNGKYVFVPIMFTVIEEK